MYLLFRYHHMKPSEIYWLPPGERQVIYAFMKHEMDQRNEENPPPDGSEN